jgi:RES domain-containing protein
MQLFRIGSALYPLFDGAGAFQHGARWNSPGRRVIYCAESLACCRLEMLVHIGRMSLRPVNHVAIVIEVPNDLYAAAQTLASPPPGWDHPTAHDISQPIGDSWFDAGKSLILRVPSVAANGDWVVLLNQAHPDFAKISASAPRPLDWDERLFQ